MRERRKAQFPTGFEPGTSRSIVWCATAWATTRTTFDANFVLSKIIGPVGSEAQRVIGFLLLYIFKSVALIQIPQGGACCVACGETSLIFKYWTSIYKIGGFLLIFVVKNFWEFNPLLIEISLMRLLPAHFRRCRNAKRCCHCHNPNFGIEFMILGKEKLFWSKEFLGFNLKSWTLVSKNRIHGRWQKKREKKEREKRENNRLRK